MKKIYAIIIMCVLSTSAWACHATVLVTPSVTTNATDIVINAGSDAASCGCGPYWMEVEVSYTASFTGAAPIPASAAWGTFPWYHSLLNVPNYNQASGWPDNCAFEPYTTINIPLSSLCAGSTVYVRMREHVEGSASMGPWTTAASVAVPGPAPVLSGSALASNNALCPNDSTLLSVSHNGCSGNYVVSWTPTANVNNPSGISTYAFPTTTTTYTVSFTDVALAQTFTSTVTVLVSSPMTVSLSSTIESCNQADANVTTSSGGGIYPHTFLWSNSATTANLSGVSSGSYTITVTDSIGCVATASVVVTDSCDYVWPGDADDDATANSNDILAIGLANGTTGSTRVGATINWIGQYSAPWGIFTPLGIDNNFIDCNGDGAVNASDTTAVVQNWGMVHNNRLAPPAPAGSSPSLEVHFVQDTIAPSTSGAFAITFGDTVTMAANIYGLAFTLNYDETYIDPMSFSVSAAGSWLGTIGTDMIVVKKMYPGMGMMDVVVTRMDQNNVTGMGTILTFTFSSTSALTGTGLSATTPVTISNVYCINSFANVFGVLTENDSITITDDFMTGLQSMSAAITVVYPNPAATQFVVRTPSLGDNTSFVLFNALGQEVKRVVLTKNEQAISCEELNEGAYFYRVENATGVISSGKLIKE